MDGEDFLNGGMTMGGDVIGDPSGEMSWEQGGHITLFDETSPRFFNDSFASPAPPETPMLGGAAKAPQLYSESDFLGYGRRLQPGSMDGGSSTSPESSVPDSSSDSSRSRKRKPSTVMTGETMDLGWAMHEGSLSPEMHKMKQETDQAVDAMGTQMASQFPDFSGPNSPQEQTITPSKLQQNFGMRNQVPTASPSKAAFFLGSESRDGSPSSANAMSSDNSPHMFNGYQSPSPMTRKRMTAPAIWDTNSQWAQGQHPAYAGAASSPFRATVSPAALQNGQMPGLGTQAALYIGSETGKSRVETQIKITLSVDPLPAGISAIHLPTPLS
ncbi:uncharacterized protein BDZ99DRAFT_286388 [Mytilinidion resinicola]|uniref:Uncharacterized protein n=1 Tax=Mytilinidion resinicola TaxID=574789 RepID=A0A6A6YQ39_9PEZI|nr:uncharacterized protein BDZ99DRAFT_286388 [Mytilinidion resinicola]KAF2810639.1 hypothetical protein BDZ99DRAFT_286388 [Mytilinidion resinicola]